MESFDLKKATPDEKFDEVENYIASIQDIFISFGELLSNIKRTEAYKAKGYKSLKELLEKEYNLAGSFASKLIDTYDLFCEEMDLDEFDYKSIGFDRLNMIKPLVKNNDIQEAESWIENAKQLDTATLREKVKEAKVKTEKRESLKDIFIKQFVEKMITHLRCSTKDLQFKLAVYFQDADLESVNTIIKEKIKKLEIKE